MRFDSNRAWNDAMAAVKANREVLLALAGVFFLLPTLLSTVFLTDIQTQIMESMQKPELMKRLMEDNMGLLLGFGIGTTVLQMIGYLAVTALISDRSRPTVGESISWGLRALPSLFAVGVIGVIAMMVGLFLVTMVIAGIFAVLGVPMVGGFVAVVVILLLMAYISIRLALVVPVIVNEGLTGPVLAMVRSWKLTRGNVTRLFGFFTLLTLGYFAIALVTTMLLVGPVMLVLGQGKIALLVMGLVSGAIGAATSVVLAAVLAQTHRQLMGGTPEAVADLFE